MHEEVLNRIGNARPMAADLTIPLLRRLAQSPIRNYEYLGVIDPEFYMAPAGVYALEPYQPGKIPVVLVNGIWSSPRVWGPMLATLEQIQRSARHTSSGSSFTLQATRCRSPLCQSAAPCVKSAMNLIRQRPTPRSTRWSSWARVPGGQVTRMLVEPSGKALWNAIFAQPIEQIHASRCDRRAFQSLFL